MSKVGTLFMMIHADGDFLFFFLLENDPCHKTLSIIFFLLLSFNFVA